MHGCWSETRFVVRQSRDTDWETAFSDVPGLVVVRILLGTIQNSSSRPLKLRATADTSGNCGRLNDLLSTTVDDRRGRAPRDSNRRPQRPSPKRYAFLTSSQGKTVEGAWDSVEAIAYDPHLCDNTTGVICEYSESSITGH